MDWTTFFTALSATIVACYGLYKGIKEIKASSKAGREKYQKALEEEKKQRIEEIQTAVKPMISEIEKKLDQHIEENEIWTIQYSNDVAETRRVRILRNRDDLQNKYIPWPSESAFLQMLEDCSGYKSYLKKNPDFHNGIGQDAMEIIRESYNYCKKENLFSKEKE